MYTIRVTCKAPNDKRAHAPYLAGELEVRGNLTGDPLLSFLIDTGADNTAMPQTVARLPPPVWQQGHRDYTRGVGGLWPTRRFVDQAFLHVLATSDEGDDVPLRLPLPFLNVLAPYADFTDEERPREVLTIARGDRRLQGKHPVVRECELPYMLLGRDIFYAAHAKLKYDPRGESAILVPSSAVQEAPAAPAGAATAPQQAAGTPSHPI